MGTYFWNRLVQQRLHLIAYNGLHKGIPIDLKFSEAVWRAEWSNPATKTQRWCISFNSCKWYHQADTFESISSGLMISCL